MRPHSAARIRRDATSSNLILGSLREDRRRGVRRPVRDVRVRLVLRASEDPARTASNIASHAGLFRVGTVCELLAGVFVVLLNAALFELLAPVNRGLARFAAFLRIVEVSVGTAIAAGSFVILSMLSSAGLPRGFDQLQVQSMAQLVAGAQESGFVVTLLFFGAGQATYMFLLARSGYVPKPLALVGLFGSAGAAVFALARMLFPGAVAALFTAVKALPAVALAILALILSPFILFELALGLWLLIKGVRSDRARA